MAVSFRLIIISAVFVTCLITANIIAVKVASLGPFLLPAAIFVFPLSYIVGDILTEVYGYGWTRRIIWLGFVCNLVFVFFAWIAQVLPGAPFWEAQEAYVRILGYTPRLLGASFAGYLAGEFINSYIMARLKARTRGRWLWSRTIGSTVVGQGADTAIFITLAFIGTPAFAPEMIFFHWAAKTGIEIILTPLTYFIVNRLKTSEGAEVFDEGISFNPFRITD